MWNSTDDEAARLGKLQGLHDEATERRLRALGLGPGWHCLELGAGAGSVATWMADQVGPSGTVTAVDRDTAQLQRLGERDNVSVVQRRPHHHGLPRRHLRRHPFAFGPHAHRRGRRRRGQARPRPPPRWRRPLRGGRRGAGDGGGGPAGRLRGRHGPAGPPLDLGPAPARAPARPGPGRRPRRRP